MSRVFATLHDQGWFDTSRPFEYSVNLTRGACVWLLLSRQGRGEMVVKFSETMPLAQEAGRSRLASLTYPQFAPAFVGHVHAEGLDLIASKATDALGLTPQEVIRSRRGAPLLRCLAAYFEATPRAAAAPSDPATVRNRQLERPIVQYFDRGQLAALAQRWSTGAAMTLALELPDMPQHGDLVLNNIGLREPDGMVIYDWEDYGASSLPGLDLFTLELSLAEDPARLLEMRRADVAALGHLKKQACKSLGLMLEDYHALTPIYALVFRYLKRNYGPWVRERMDRLLLTLDQL